MEKITMNKRFRWKGTRFVGKSGSNNDRRIFNIVLHEGYYCDINYEIEIGENYEVTDQGLLLIGKLKPKNNTLPEFWLRWDAKDQTLDIDIYNSNEIQNWNNEINGYKGHHTEKNPDGKYKVTITIPKYKIFEGAISFNRVIDIEVVDCTKSVDDTNTN